MTTGDDLLRGILEYPAADDLRLIYADWIDENGSTERAEFIRVQCKTELLSAVDRRCPDIGSYGRAVPRWRDGTCHCDGCVLRRAEEEFVSSHLWRVLRDELPPLLWQEFDRWRVHYKEGQRWIQSRRDEDLELLFERGFISRIECTLAQWEQHGPTLVAAHPVESVRLTDREPWHNPRNRRAWSWSSYTRLFSALPWYVSRPIVQQMPERYLIADTGLAWFATGAEADAILSYAALNWARSKVVPPLPPLPIKR